MPAELSQTPGGVGIAWTEQRNNLIDEPMGLLDLLLGGGLILLQVLGGLSHLKIDPAQDGGQLLGLGGLPPGPGGNWMAGQDRLHLLQSRGRLSSTC